MKPVKPHFSLLTAFYVAKKSFESGKHLIQAGKSHNNQGTVGRALTLFINGMGEKGEK